MAISSIQTPFVIILSGQAWLVLADGSWQIITNEVDIPEGVNQFDVTPENISQFNDEFYVSIDDTLIEIPNEIVASTPFEILLADHPELSQKTNKNASHNTSNDDPEGSLSFFGNIGRTGDEVIATSGFVTTPDLDELTNKDESSFGDSDGPNDRDAFITVEVIETCTGTGDGEIYDIVGTVDDVEDGNIVQVVVVDQAGNQATFDTVIINGEWAINNADLTGLNDGELLVVASTSDRVNNSATASTTFEKDTAADITINVDTGSDSVINADESGHTTISGTVTDVENGQNVTVIVTDSANNQLEFNTSVVDGAWQIVDADLSSLDDGVLTYSADVTDLNCNEATVTTTTPKDTLAQISVVINSGADDYLSVAELSPVYISGTVANVEAGQQVTLVLTNTGGETDTITAIIQSDLTYLASVDIHQYAPGTLTVEASISDVAGNPASANDTAIIDILPEITINVDTSEDVTDNTLNANEATAVNISGTLNHIEDGQTITVTVSDGIDTLTFKTVVNGATWLIENNDLSSLADGELTYTASATNLVGNLAVNNTVTQKDTLAEITIAVDTNGEVADDTINNSEATQVRIYGTVTHIENDHTVFLSVTDGLITLEFPAEIIDGEWQVTADLSSLADTTITYTANVSDDAGNDASSSITTEKDTTAQISMVVNTNSHLADNILNAAEIENVVISGTVTDIDDGQTIFITVSDGTTTLNFNTKVSGNTWSINEDLSTLSDGTLTYNASVIDVAGNLATDSTNTEKDTVANISVQIESGDDEFLLLSEISPLLITGAVVNVEAGQVVKLTIVHAGGTTDTTTAVVQSDLTYSASVTLTDSSDGLLTVSAEVADAAGNPASAIDTATIDQTAIITIDVDTGGDGTINDAEEHHVKIFGTVVDVEDGQTVTISVSDGLYTLDFETSVQDNTWQIVENLSALKDGTLTYTATVNDIAGNIATNTTTTEKDTANVITVHIETGDDEYLNASETNTVEITGVALFIEVGQVVTLTLRNFHGDVTQTTAIIQPDKKYSATVDLSSFADGPIAVLAQVDDDAGNPARAYDLAEIDQTAAITIVVDSNTDIVDDIINANEVTAVNVSGTVTDIDDGQEITIVVSDGTTTIYFYTTVNATDNGENWTIGDIDLSDFTEGEITYTASVTDIAGNAVQASTSTEKDTLADITLTVNTNANFTDNVLNAAEIENVVISGSVSHVEDGKIITITVSDGSNTLEFTTPVSGNTWSITEDLSALSDGTLSFNATVTDIAGNQASDSTTTGKDTLADISVHIESGDDEYLLVEEINPVVITGTVTNIEVGTQVNLTITHEGGVVDLTTAIVQADYTYSTSLTLTDPSDGLLTVVANVSDAAGNPASATDTATIDQTATITIAVNTNEDVVDNIINDQEEHAVDLSGEVSHVEDGQEIEVSVTDGTHTLFFTTSVAGNTWQIDDTNLSSLKDGTLTYTATVTDIAGNVATDTTTTEKDTSDVISVHIESGSDEFLSGEETSAVEITGVALLIEVGQEVTLTVRNFHGDVARATAIIQPDFRYSAIVDLSDFADGPVAVLAAATDLAGNSAQAYDLAVIDQTAEITIVVDTNADVTDNIINENEVDNVSFSGSVTDVEDDQMVTIEVTDGTDTLKFTAEVIAGAWTYSNADLTSLSDGELTYTASVADVLGNTATAETTTEKDTQASITITVDTNEDTPDNTINAAEAPNVVISGTVSDVNNSSKITVRVTDGTTTLTFDTTVNGNNWTLAPQNLSALNDTTLTYTAEVTDAAGNFATAETTTEKDTQASVTISIDTDADVEDNTLNSNEVNSVDISGTVNNVEDGQTIYVTVTDGTTTLPFDVLVSGTNWAIDAADFSSLNDGEITYTATVTDIAGNEASNSNTAIIDTQVNIDIDTAESGLNTADFRANNISQMSGTTDAEINQEVSLIVSDGSLSKPFVGTVGAGGVWTVSGIDVTGLSDSLPWSITVSVFDLAGNEASDDMPTIDVPSTNEVSELVEDIAGSDSSEQPININNADLSLGSAALQTELGALTSAGSNVTVIVASDGQSLTVIRNSDNDLLLTATLVDGKIAIELQGYFDHASNSFDTTVFIEALQTDDDGTSELVILPSTITIIDSVPFAINDHSTVIEDTTSYGSLTGNDYTHEGPLTVTSFNYDGTNYTIVEGSSQTINTIYGDLTIDSKGAWTFVAADNLDNTQVQEFHITYQVKEIDHGENSATAIFVIEDGAAGTMDDVVVSATEPKDEISQITNIPFSIIAGSDTLLPDSITFQQYASYQFEALDLSSNGDKLTYEMSTDGKIITASTGSLVVFTVTLSADNQGDDLQATAVFEQFQPIDHIDNDTVEMFTTVSATDLDGTDIISGDLALLLSDGGNPRFANISTITLDESLLIAGEQVATGKMSTFVGSDDIVSVEFSKTNRQPELTDNGISIKYQLSPDGKTLTGYIDDVNDPHFIAVLSDNFNAKTDTVDSDYVFTLYKTLDQDVADTIPLKVTVTDFDGDSTQNHLNITIIDDGSAVITTPDLIVAEIPNDPANSTAPNSDSGNITIEVGQDSLASLGYAVTNADAVLDSNGNELKQNGQTIVWQNLNNGTLQGVLSSSGEVVFDVTLPSNFDPNATSVNINFHLFGAVDHNAPQSDSLNIIVPIVLIDQDGSQTFSDMNVQVYDGLNPEIDTSGTAYLVDEGLLTENASVVVEGSYGVDKGSDQVVSVALADNFTFSGASTRGGINVTLASNPDGNNWYVARADDNNSMVFRVRFNADGSYEYEQFYALDHADAEGENQLTLNFDVQAIDADGDKSSEQSVSVNVKDDIPVSADVSVNFAEGDTVEVDLLTAKKQGADGATITNITYLGVNYAPGVTIILEDNEGVKYGELVIEAEGSATIVSNRYLSEADTYLDNVTFDVTDNDNDVITNTLNITIKDGTGTIVKFDTETDEDTPVPLTIIASPGDQDQNEQVSEIRINIASLNGGSITLNGVTPPDDGTDYILSGGLIHTVVVQVDVDGDGDLVDVNTVQPNGDLAFTPALNASDAIENQTVDIRIDVVIVSDNGTNTVENTLHVDVNSIADVPVWDDANSTYEYNADFDGSVVEDGPATPINIIANLTDTDGSEQLTYRIENIDENLILTTNDGSTKILSNGDILSSAELASLTATTVADSAGEMTFDVIAISTEQDNGDSIEQDAKTISLFVQPVSDQPVLNVKSIQSKEDEPINLNDVISGFQTDKDGSEVLSVELTVPEGWSLVGLNGALVTEQSSNVWIAQGVDITANNVQLIPKQDLSSVVNGSIIKYGIGVVGISTDTTIDGVPVADSGTRTPSKTINVTLKGVVDAPEIEVTPDWTLGFDSEQNKYTITQNIVVNEDVNAPLDFHIVTSDIDGSEVVSITISELPTGFTFVDVNGDEVILEIVESVNNSPIYSITSDALQNLFLKAPEDYSGKTSFEITVISTEPDGDSGQYNATVEVVYSPVIDETALTLATSSEGIEDLAAVITFASPLTEDNDGSEIITGAVITSIPDGVLLILDGSIIDASTDVDLSIIAADLSISLEQLLESGRLAILPPEDATGIYQLGIDYTIVDTSLEGDSNPQILSTTAEIIVTAKVDENTRFEAPTETLISTDGAPIELTGQVSFYDDDNDGSEVLDYVVLVMPAVDGWIVADANGTPLYSDGDGRWYVPLPDGLTVDDVKEQGVDILTGITIASEFITDSPVTIQVEGRVTDITDHDMIFADFTVQFNVPSSNSQASPVSTLQVSPIDGVEDQVISFAGHLNTDITNDPNDLVSYRVLASDLPAGVTLSGSGVEVVHDVSGKNVLEYLFDSDAFQDLSISSAGDNFAGVLDIPITIIVLDPESGDTIIDDSQALQLDVTPVVDGIGFTDAGYSIEEDVLFPLLAQFELLDQDPSASEGGQERVLIDENNVDNNLTITLLNGGSLVDPTGNFVLKDGTTDTYQFTGTTQAGLRASLALVSFLPIENLAGNGVMQVQVTGSVVDTALMLSGEVSVTEGFSNIIDLNVTPVTDKANLTTGYIEGNEDRLIDMSSLGASLIDQDGSETISIAINGVPAGAVLGTNNGGILTQLVSNGVDGGTFNGEPTYSWTLTVADLANLVLYPSTNFHGEIQLQLQAVTKDQDPGVYVTTTSEFTVGVKPVGDGADVYEAPIAPNEGEYDGDEGSEVAIDLGAISTDTLNDEVIQITVTIAADSDASALVGIENDAAIRVGANSAGFVSDGNGGFTATLTTDSNEIDQFYFNGGSLAWGEFNMAVDVATVDSDLINGTTITSVSEAQSFDFTLELTPEVDAPVWLEYGDVLANDPNYVPLGLSLTLQNPATAEGEEGFLRVSGLGDNMSLNAGSQDGNDWIVNFDDVAALQVIGTTDGDNFNLTLTPYAELNSETASGATEVINVDVDSTNPAPESLQSPSFASSMSSFSYEHDILNSDNSTMSQVLDELTQSNGHVEHL